MHSGIGNQFKNVYSAAVMILLPLLLGAGASGASYFNTADGDWATAANWTGGLPSASSAATVGTTTAGGLSTALARILADVGTTSSRVSLTLGAQLGTTGTVVQDAGNVYFNGPTIGNLGTGVYTLNGGTFNTYGMTLAATYTFGPPRIPSYGTFNINGNSDGSGSRLNATGLSIGVWGVGVVNQVGGTVVVNNNGSGNTVMLGQNSATANPAGNGTYNLSGGGVLTIGKGGPGGYPLYMPTPGALIVGSYGVGVFNIGDATSTGTVNEAGPGTVGVNLTIRAQNYGGSAGTLRGWGTITQTGTFTNNGRVIADGYGTDRTLSIGSYGTFANGIANPVANGTNGFFAVNRGRLSLKTIAVAAGTNTYRWGEDAGTQDLVNSVKLVMTSVQTAGTLDISLLAPDRSDVPAGLDKPVGIWDMTVGGGLNLGAGTAALTFRYDDAQAATLGLTESSLKLYQYSAGAWGQVTSGVSIDQNNNLLTATGLTGLTKFALAGGLTLPGDVNQNVLLDAGDIDAIYLSMRLVGPYDSRCDIDHNGVVDQGDVDTWLGPAIFNRTSYGDANLDRAIDFVDFQTLLDNWQAGGGWANGDFTGDGTVDFQDFQDLLDNWNPMGFTGQPVPEPATLSLLGLGALALLRRGKRFAR